jgi:5-bromo-4-chloroindolyl phosphate hydrolysis protein
MAVVKKKTVLPIYLVGLVWLIWALSRPLYRTVDYMLAAALSVLVYIVAKAIFPDREFQTGEQLEEEKAESVKQEQDAPSYPPEIQALVTERNRAVSEMRRLNDAIKDEIISAQIDRLESVTGKIVDAVVAEPSKQPQIRKFMNYYLPTTLKLLNAYDRMGATGVAGENITATMERVEKMMGTIVTAFEKQLDSLFGADALDISTDITVLETMMAREGLAGERMEAETTRNADGTDIKLEL